MSAAIAKSKKATLPQLVFLIYGVVCAGAYGVEDMISTAGPGVALVTLALMPFLFSIPVSFAVAELTSMHPVEGGNYRWSRLAFGDFWGFQAGWWSWTTGVITNGLFAVLFVDYLADWFPALRGVNHWLACLALIWGVHWLNVRGIQTVGQLATVLSIVILGIFAVLMVLGFMQWNHNPISPFVAPAKSAAGGFGSALLLAIWLYSSYDKLSAAAEEVENPRRNFPPALFAAATLAMLSYVLPTAAALAARGNWQDWSVGYFTTVAVQIGGAGLGLAMTFGGLCSNALSLNVTTLAVSRYPLAMARDGLLPETLARTHQKFGAPTRSLFAGSLACSALALFDFTQLITIYSWFQMASYILLYANVWVLRRTHSHAERPFQIPFGKAGLAGAMILTCGMALLAIGSTVFENGRFSSGQFLTGALALLTGPILFWTIQAAKAGLRPTPCCAGDILPSVTVSASSAPAPEPMLKAA